FSPLASQSQEVKNARKIAEWLTNNLEFVLPKNVQSDLLKVAVFVMPSLGGSGQHSLSLDP
ncbi:hypothetical protein HAX54_049774, partial [Datura stramonium]|nr:hypothetical protein [Datura stramonium]